MIVNLMARACVNCGPFEQVCRPPEKPISTYGPYIPCAGEVERRRALDEHEAERLDVEPDGGVDGYAQAGDVVECHHRRRRHVLVQLSRDGRVVGDRATDELLLRVTPSSSALFVLPQLPARSRRVPARFSHGQSQSWPLSLGVFYSPRAGWVSIRSGDPPQTRSDATRAALPIEGERGCVHVTVTHGAGARSSCRRAGMPRSHAPLAWMGGLGRRGGRKARQAATAVAWDWDSRARAPVRSAVGTVWPPSGQGGVLTPSAALWLQTCHAPAPAPAP
jgi:hypothetical protein